MADLPQAGTGATPPQQLPAQLTLENKFKINGREVQLTPEEVQRHVQESAAAQENFRAAAAKEKALQEKEAALSKQEALVKEAQQYQQDLEAVQHFQDDPGKGGPAFVRLAMKSGMTEDQARQQLELAMTAPGTPIPKQPAQEPAVPYRAPPPVWQKKLAEAFQKHQWDPDDFVGAVSDIVEERGKARAMRKVDETLDNAPEIGTILARGGPLADTIRKDVQAAVDRRVRGGQSLTEATQEVLQSRSALLDALVKATQPEPAKWRPDFSQPWMGQPTLGPAPTVASALKLHQSEPLDPKTQTREWIDQLMQRAVQGEQD